MAKQSNRSKKKRATALRVTMLGAFMIAQETEVFPGEASSDGAVSTAALEPTFETTVELAASLTGRAHRLWLLVAYLVVNRHRGVPPQELIDLLWPEVTSNNPASTLQNNVSRARALFSDEHFGDSRELIKHVDGLYYWAPEETTVLDIEVFEENARRIGDAIPFNDPALLDLALETCELYRGDFLSDAADVSWCANLSVYYRTLFKQLCKTTATALLEAGRPKEAQALCLRIIALEPGSEEFNVLLMRSLIADNDAAAALDRYQKIADHLLETYDIAPSAALETQREIALQELYGQSMTEESIRSFLFDSTQDDGAFACNNAVFREIALLRMREMERTGVDSHLIAITIDSRMAKSDRRIINAKRVSQVLSSTLRASDPFTKVGSNQFLILLPGASEANAQLVFDRIVDRFHEVFPQADVAFKVSMVSLGAFRE